MSGGWTAAEGIVGAPVSEDITITGFYVYIATAPGSGKSWDFYIKQNGSNTSANVNIADSATSGSWTGSVSITAGDLIYLSSVPTGSPTSAGHVDWYVYYETTGKSFIMLGGSFQTTATTGTRYMLPTSTSGSSVSSSSTSFEVVMPADGTITAFYVATPDGSPGSGKSYAVSVLKNDTTDVITATIADTNTSASATGSESFSAGDTLIIKCTPSGTPTARRITCCMSITPSALGECYFGFGSANLPSNSGTTYEQTNGDGGGWVASESARYMSSLPPETVRKLHWKASTAPGSTRSWTLTLRDSSSDTSITSTISESNTTGSDTSNSVTLTGGGAYNSWKMVPSSSPVPYAMTGGAHIGYVIYIPQNRVRVKISSTFVEKPVNVKISGTFSEKPASPKVGGGFV
jgi:hypothetical protein